MRNRLKIGVPLAAGLAAGGYALSQGEDPGSAALAAGAGALGGAAGLLGARAVTPRLAGRYADSVQSLANQIGQTGGSALQALGAKIPEKAKANPSSMRMGAMRGATRGINALTNALQEAVYSPEATALNVKRGLGAIAAPAGALAAGLGGVALGAVPGAMGIPGFQQQQYMDPEQYGSSNTTGALATTDGSMTTLRYM
jgi:hypothetical protein